jgi:hypothetical protein
MRPVLSEWKPKIYHCQQHQEATPATTDLDQWQLCLVHHGLLLLLRRRLQHLYLSEWQCGRAVPRDATAVRCWAQLSTTTLVPRPPPTPIIVVGDKSTNRDFRPEENRPLIAVLFVRNE